MSEQLYAGFAKRDITPPHPRGMTLLGMDRVYPGAQGVLDPLFVRAAYIGTRSRGVLMLVLDTVYTMLLDPHRGEVLAELARITGLPTANIWLLCTHCHSAFGEEYRPTWAGGDHYRMRTLSAFLDLLLPRVVAAGAEAFRKRQAAEIGYGAAPVTRVGSCRRFKTSAGIVLSAWANGPCPPPGLRLATRGPHDPDVGLVVFRDRRHRPIGALVNYNSHIHLYPTLKVSAELAGAVMRKMERRFPGMLPIYTNGAEGTTSLDADLPPQSPRPEDWDDQQRAGLQAFSRRMIRGIEAAWRGMTFASRVRLRCAEAKVALRLRRDGAPGSQPLIEHLKALAINDLALLGEQEEAWCEFALDLKAASPFPTTFVLGFVGSKTCYFPTAHGIEEGGYESHVRFHGDGFAATVRGAVKLLHKLHRESRR